MRNRKCEIEIAKRKQNAFALQIADNKNKATWEIVHKIIRKRGNNYNCSLNCDTLNELFVKTAIEISKSIPDETIKVTEFIEKHHTENNKYVSFTKISEIEIRNIITELKAKRKWEDVHDISVNSFSLTNHNSK